jgi:8-oxo-dGTP pyrophosphatase MutT (NUDIX family)
MAHPTIRFQAVGDWPPGRVSQLWVPDGRRRHPAVDAAIDAAWAAATARPGVRLFDGPMCRLERWHATPERLQLDLSPTSYKPFLGTNMTNPSLADAFGPEVMANPVGVSPALLTSDGFLLLGRRNASVAYYPGRTHPFSGSLEPTDADAFAAVARELAEELSLAAAEVVDVRCTGVAEDLALRQPELIFAAVTTAPRSAVVARLDPDEHAGTWSVQAEADAVAAAIVGERDQLTPVAAAALLLWGRLRFGDRWFTEAAAPVAIHP